MNIEISRDALNATVLRQISSLFLLSVEESELILELMDDVLARCEKCFSMSRNKYYLLDDQVYFNPYHSGQYTIFLYFLSNSIFKTGRYRTLADRVYYLNKSLNSCDLFYEVELPSIFMLDHPVGSVIGRASFGDFFSFSQNCTVGNNKGIFPQIGENVKMLSGSKILGNSKIGDDVIISANTYIKDTDVPSNTIVFGSTPNLIFKKNNIIYGKRLL